MPSRIAVLAVLEPVRGHLSVAEIHRRLNECQHAQPSDLATIYRTVATLVKHGVLHALTVNGGVTTYGLAARPHHHAVCTRCSSITEVPAQELTSALDHAMAGSSFKLSERAGLTLHGLCPHCQPNPRSSRPELVRLSRKAPRPRRRRRASTWVFAEKTAAAVSIPDPRTGCGQPI